MPRDQSSQLRPGPKWKYVTEPRHDVKIRVRDVAGEVEGGAHRHERVDRAVNDSRRNAKPAKLRRSRWRAAHGGKLAHEPLGFGYATAAVIKEATKLECFVVMAQRRCARAGQSSLVGQEAMGNALP